MGSSPSIPEGAAEFEDTEALLKAAKTGDVLLFCGRGFFSSIVRFGSVGRIGWSHSAVVVTGKTATGGKAVWLVESNPPLPMTDLITRTVGKDGPQMLNLRQRLATYDGFFVGLRKLKFKALLDPDIESSERTEWGKRLKAATMIVSSSTYEYDPTKFWGAATRTNVDTPGSFFCTEFSAYALSVAGILKKTQPFEDFTLDDFASPRALVPTIGLRFDPPIYAKL